MKHLEKIQKDIKTLEKAVYSGSVELNNENLGSSIDNMIIQKMY